MDGPRRLFLLTISVLTMCIGLRMLSATPRDYALDFYRTAFAVMPLVWWGWLFTIVGAVMTIIPRNNVYAVLAYVFGAIVWTLWAFCIMLDNYQRAGILQPIGYAVMCIIGAYAVHKNYSNIQDRKT